MMKVWMHVDNTEHCFYILCRHHCYSDNCSGGAFGRTFIIVYTLNAWLYITDSSSILYYSGITTAHDIMVQSFNIDTFNLVMSDPKNLL